MLNSEDTVSTIMNNAGFKRSKNENSYYKTYDTNNGPIQVRISNLGTDLLEWLENSLIEPKKCYANISIVFSDDGTYQSNTKIDIDIHKWNDFEVIQYVYNLSKLTSRNVGLINKMIQTIPKNGNYHDPFQDNSEKHANVVKLTSNKS